MYCQYLFKDVAELKAVFASIESTRPTDGGINESESDECFIRVSDETIIVILKGYWASLREHVMSEVLTEKPMKHDHKFNIITHTGRYDVSYGDSYNVGYGLTTKDLEVECQVIQSIVDAKSLPKSERDKLHGDTGVDLIDDVDLVGAYNMTSETTSFLKDVDRKMSKLVRRIGDLCEKMDEKLSKINNKLMDQLDEINKVKSEIIADRDAVRI